MVKCEENVGDDGYWSVWVGGIGNDNDGEVWKLCGGVNIAVHNKGEADGEFCGVWWCMLAMAADGSSALNSVWQ